MVSDIQDGIVMSRGCERGGCVPTVRAVLWHKCDAFWSGSGIGMIRTLRVKIGFCPDET